MYRVCVYISLMTSGEFVRFYRLSTTYFKTQTVNYFYNGLMFVINKYIYRKIHNNLLMLLMIFLDFKR